MRSVFDPRPAAVGVARLSRESRQGSLSRFERCSFDLDDGQDG